MKPAVGTITMDLSTQTYLARNTSFLSSPVEAVSGTNEETLKATPYEKVVDSITRHRPLDGIALTPPGQPDAHGRVLVYEEGADLMVEAGYKRWPGVVGLFVLPRSGQQLTLASCLGVPTGRLQR